MDAAAEIGRNPVSKHQIRHEYGDKQADAGRDCRTRLARPNSQARTGTGEIFIFPVELTTSRIGNLIRLILTLAICDDRKYIPVYIRVDEQGRAIFSRGWNGEQLQRGQPFFFGFKKAWAAL